MNTTVRIIRLIVLLSCLNPAFSQSFEEHFVMPDSLKKYSYNETYKIYELYYEDTLKSKVLLRSCLEKAKANVDSIKMARVYNQLFYYVNNDSLKLDFLDKSIKLSETINHKLFPAYSYSNKGGFYLGKWDFEKALDNYLEALAFSKKNKNEDFQYLTQHNIGIIKSKLGKHKEALGIFRDCLKYELKKGITDTLDYLDIMVDLTESYSKNNLVDSSNYYLKKVLPISKRYDTGLYSKFTFIKGLNFYYQQKNEEAKESFKEALPYLSQLADKREMVNTYFYLGKINETLSNNTTSVTYYKKVDSILQKTEFITPEVREGYLFLIDSYKAKRDFKNQLFYVDRLLAFDSIMLKNNTQVNEKLIKQYDTAKLLAEKEKLIAAIYDKNSNFKLYIWVLVVIVLSLMILFYYQFQKRKLYAQRFSVFMESESSKIEKTANESKLDTKVLEVKKLKIAEEIKEDILRKIERFEENKEYLEPNITTNSLAERFKTNSKYVSRIVNIYKEKNFKNYVNDLRIDYLIQELKTNKKFRNYTIKAISSEIGFNTTEAFSKYFHKKTGLYPSYFIKKMSEYQDEPEVNV
ncbi:helix-turn-helix domain-containing protein [Aquimarina sp. D1M17]|uniref:AraC family transcriptional regulator n=1 Tax=Aquimarina acroporae TaxID=2937283 RepID=UPI0020C11BCD|nr:AraC family transcriptional regulator [Aquimarina acroporae]MCK8522711.1 helix-turn-helix domain-containing protein [Aquimarina acroporae]